MSTSSARARKFRTACDRCYELKERCTRATPFIACERCDRLGLVCSIVRPVRPAGRRPHQREYPQSRTTPSSQSSNVELDIGTWLRDMPNLSPEEKELLMFLLGNSDNLECFVASSSFQEAQRRSLAALLPSALPVLKDAYLACAGALKMLQTGMATEMEKSTSLCRASSAMRTLRSLPVVTSQDAAVCLTLGTVLSLFVYSAIGVGVADICHHSLSMTKQFPQIAVSDPDSKPRQTLLVLLETMECLVHRQKPTLRVQFRVQEEVDRHLGLCSSLLPHYYDLCVISHSLVNTTDASYSVHLQKQLARTQGAVEAWQPSHPEDFVERFESAEVVNLLAQARAYRFAGLLVSHRLQHVFGQQDSQADSWSKEVMMELELAHQITKRPIRWVTLPFVIAAIEIQEPIARVRALQNVDRYVDQFTPVVQKATKAFLSRIWYERDMKMILHWFDSVQKPCAVLDYINTTLFS